MQKRQLPKLLIVVLIGALISGASIGCAGRTSLIPNSDPALRKSATQFAADAASRFPYPADAPKGGEADARAQVGYSLNKIEIANLSSEEWHDVEIWINGTHVVYLPTLQPPKDDLPRMKTLHFQMIYDDKGNYFPVDNKKILVKKVEIFRDGKLYNVRTAQAD
jgi:hypothetical protein